MVNWGKLEGAPKWFNTPWKKLDFRFSEEEELEIERYTEKIKENIEEDKMTPMERWNATMEGQEVDRILVYLAPLTTYSIRVLDGFSNAVKPIDSFRNPKLFLKAHMAFAARFGTDCIDFYTLSYGESLWGGKAKLLELAHPVMTEPGVKSMEDADRLVVPDPRKHGLYPGDLWAVNKCKQIFKKYGLEGVMPILASCCSPPAWIVATCVRGLKNGFLDPIRNVDLWHKLIEKTTKFEIDYAKALWEADADVVWCCQHHSAWPPKVFREHIAPYDARLAKEGPLHGWGYAFNQEKHVEILRELGGYDPVKWVALDTETPVEFARQFTKEMNKAYTCIETDKTLATNPKTIEDAVKEHMKIGTSTPGVGFGMVAGSIDYWTPPENCDAFVKYVKEYGKFPIKL